MKFISFLIHFNSLFFVNFFLEFLKKPTTGLDPASKRGLWEIILKARKRYCIVLTTHSMEEAEGLCDRIGIVVNGQLACLGTLLHLKQKFGKGQFNFNFSFIHFQKVLKS